MPHRGERLDRARRARPSLETRSCALEREAHLRRDGQDRIERRSSGPGTPSRCVRPRKRAQLLAPQPDQFLPGELDRAGDDAAGRIDQAEDARSPVTLLPEPGFADQPDDLAALSTSKRHAVDRLHDAGAREEVRREIAHLERARSSLQPRVELVAHLVADEVDARRSAR